MATLNPGRILARRSIADDFDVVRRDEIVSKTNGRAGFAATTISSWGVVTYTSPTDLKRFPEAELMERCITVVSQNQMRGSSPGAQPDIVVWRGDNYLVRSCDPYNHFGAGFYRVIAEATGASLDATPTEVAGDGL